MDQRVDAINQVFALFRLNYHNQYYSAFPDESQLNQIKKLWLDALGNETPDAILRAARYCIENFEYLPTLNRFLEASRDRKHAAAGLPDVHSAYREACLSKKPREAQRWSHPAVYHAGCQAGWFLLSSGAEKQVFPVFSAAYRAICEQVAAGEVLIVPQPPALPGPVSATESKADRRAHIETLRRETGIS